MDEEEGGVGLSRAITSTRRRRPRTTSWRLSWTMWGSTNLRPTREGGLGRPTGVSLSATKDGRGEDTTWRSTWGIRTERRRSTGFWDVSFVLPCYLSALCRHVPSVSGRFTLLYKSKVQSNFYFSDFTKVCNCRRLLIATTIIVT